MNNTINRVFVCSPVDKKSRLVVSQDGCEDDVFMTVKQNRELNDALVARLLQLKKMFGVKDLKEHNWIRNTVRHLKKDKKKIPPLLDEYIMLGKQIQNVNRDYAELMKNSCASVLIRSKKSKYWNIEN